MYQQIKTSLSLGLAAVIGLMALSCNENPVTLFTQSSAVEEIVRTNVGGSEMMDILFMIDNSGSMCQEQKVLRDNFAVFIETLDESSLDFHLAVTTTHMVDEFPLEPVSRPGHLQSTPQPVPGFDPSCHLAPDGAGGLIDGDFTPIRDAIAGALECAPSLNPADFAWSDADIRCAVMRQPMGCTVTGQTCGGANPPCDATVLFPNPSDYRQIPKVLRSEDYLDAQGRLRIDDLRADFACMSLVGTRGYGIEKGLAAVVEAVHPDLTGGAFEAENYQTIEGETVPVNTSAPNHGFIRQDARFAVIMVTDENDCSDGPTRLNPDRPRVDESSPCGDHVCEFANIPGLENSPIIPTSELKQLMLENLSATKNRDFSDQEVIVASIHGIPNRYEGPVFTAQQCSTAEYQGTQLCDGPQDCPLSGRCTNGRCVSPGIQPICVSALGTAFSGDRYIDFAREFPVYFPSEDFGIPDTQGLMCADDFGEDLRDIAEALLVGVGGCVTSTVFPCESDAECPAHLPDGAAASCVPVPNGGTSYCDSGIQLRARYENPEPGQLESLANNPFCMPESLGDPSFPNGCVITRSAYSLDPCPSGLAGFRIVFQDEIQASVSLGGMSVEARYVVF